MNSKKEYAKILLQEYQISDIEQLLPKYRCNIDISIFCNPWEATTTKKRLALPVYNAPCKSPK